MKRDIPIRRIAQAVRWAAVELHHLRNGRTPSYDASLAGACGACAMVMVKLSNGRLTYVEGDFDDEGHCWAESSRRIWDVTATQFGVKKEILSVSRKDRRYHGAARGPKTMRYAKPFYDIDGYIDLLTKRSKKILFGKR